MQFFESEFFQKHDTAMAASDEVGRGPLAGPVVAATVVVTDLKKSLRILSELGIDDSKKLNEKKRKNIIKDLEIELKKGSKIELQGPLSSLGYYSIQEIKADEIDKINILQASLKAMKESFLICEVGKGAWLVDGNKLPSDLPEKWRVSAIVKGDSRSLLIGLASIIAKEYRDELMKSLGQMYPGYGLEKHAGYPTKFHRQAIQDLGPSPIHRKSFKGVREFL